MTKLKFTDEQVIKIHDELCKNFEGVLDLYDYIFEQGYGIYASEGFTEFGFIESFKHPDKKAHLVFTKINENIHSEQGRFAIHIMDHVEQNDKYYGHNATEVLEQIKGKI